jgi:(p)ppGpp synthase/HD superfamily hydrolase
MKGQGWNDSCNEVTVDIRSTKSQEGELKVSLRREETAYCLAPSRAESKIQQRVSRWTLEKRAQEKRERVDEEIDRTNFKWDQMKELEMEEKNRKHARELEDTFTRVAEANCKWQRIYDNKEKGVAVENQEQEQEKEAGKQEQEQEAVGKQEQDEEIKGKGDGRNEANAICLSSDEEDDHSESSSSDGESIPSEDDLSTISVSGKNDSWNRSGYTFRFMGILPTERPTIASSDVSI